MLEQRRPRYSKGEFRVESVPLGTEVTVFSANASKTPPYDARVAAIHETVQAGNPVVVLLTDNSEGVVQVVKVGGGTAVNLAGTKI
jgi:hypothetical protein